MNSSCKNPFNFNTNANIKSSGQKNLKAKSYTFLENQSPAKNPLNKRNIDHANDPNCKSLYISKNSGLFLMKSPVFL